jgi:hypothetical protein
MLHSRVLWKVHSKDHPVAVAMSYDDTLTEGAVHRDDGFGSDAGVTRPYTDTLEGCLDVDLSVDVGVAAGRAGHDLIGA